MIHKTITPPGFKDFLYITAGILVLVLMAGCGANYGSLKRSAEVQQHFERQQVPAEYRYYYYGFDTRPYVIFGIEPEYEMNSRLWRAVSPDTAAFKTLVTWIWEDYGYYKFGADILDPLGNKVGILYSSIHETTVKFPGDNLIEVIPNTPFLWGPDAGSGVRTP